MKTPFKLIRIHAFAACAMVLTPLAAVADDVSIRLGHVLPESHSWHIATTGFAEEITTRTEGRVQIEVFPSGQLGSEKEAIEGLQFGSVQTGLIGTGSFQGVEPRMCIIEMPYAWEAREQAFAALEGELGDAFEGMPEPNGLMRCSSIPLFIAHLA
ncbi:TRAP transporter substrate-binding protein DctP [Epibacterium ulvae]|uniref:TRAP transporter substrate-binding protein DctP n=1 Tax=Epibacterium ulvae TaxID=1156985 RepID=UPI00249219A7|nr:TRAP transporter substrate-binding protein DctP [Epibacterium ulvae]